MVEGCVYGRGHAGDDFHMAVTIDCAVDPSRRPLEQQEELSMAAAVGLSMAVAVGLSSFASAGLGMVASAGLRVVAFAAFVDIHKTYFDLEVVGRGDYGPVEETRWDTARHNVQQFV